MSAKPALMHHAIASVRVTNHFRKGLHAQPAVKLAKLAKTFQGPVEITVAPEGAWVNAKDPLDVLCMKVPRGARMHVRASAKAATDALVALFESELFG